MSLLLLAFFLLLLGSLDLTVVIFFDICDITTFWVMLFPMVFLVLSASSSSKVVLLRPSLSFGAVRLLLVLVLLSPLGCFLLSLCWVVGVLFSSSFGVLLPCVSPFFLDKGN